MATYLNNSAAMKTWQAALFSDYIRTLTNDGLLTSDMVSWKKYLPVEIEQEEKDPDDDLFY